MYLYKYNMCMYIHTYAYTHLMCMYIVQVHIDVYYMWRSSLILDCSLILDSHPTTTFVPFLLRNRCRCGGNLTAQGLCFIPQIALVGDTHSDA